MSDDWNVKFILEKILTDDDRRNIEESIPRSAARIAVNESTIVGVRLEAPTAGDAIEEVGLKLRSVLNTEVLNVGYVQASKYS